MIIDVHFNVIASIIANDIMRVFVGFWKNGRRHGNSGTLIVSDGFRYEGAWVENSMEGRGVATVSHLQNSF